MTVLELTISAVVLVAVLVGTAWLIDSSRGVTQSSNDVVVASSRVDRALNPLADALRQGSLASVRHVDGSDFGSGTSGDGFQVRRVLAYRGEPIVSPLVAYRLDKSPGALEGEIVRIQGGLEEVVARGVTDFSVARAGNVFTLTIAARSGPENDRGRKSTGTVRVAARNP